MRMYYSIGTYDLQVMSPLLGGRFPAAHVLLHLAQYGGQRRQTAGATPK
jgi:hypothetical protein